MSLERMVHRSVSGVPVDEPTTYAVRVSAEVLPASAARNERLFSRQVEIARAFVVTLPYRSDVDESDRVIWHTPDRGDRVLNVVGRSNPDGRRIDLVLAATEVT